MSASISNEPASPAVDAPGHRRGPWLVAGAILWALVGVAAIAMLRNRDRDEGAAVSGDADPASTSADGISEPAPAARKVRTVRPVDASALPIWDPAGIADFELTERSGRKVTKADLLGKPWIASFVFTTCRGPCTDVMNSLTRIQEALKETDIRLVTITVDPERDSKEVLESYASAYGADPERWLFLTGDKKTIYDLTLKSFLMPIEEATGSNRIPGFEVVHTTNLLLVDEHGVVQAKYDGKMPDQVTKLIERLSGPAKAEVPEEAAPGNATSKDATPSASGAGGNSL